MTLVNEVSNEKSTKEIPLSDFFSRFCALKELSNPFTIKTYRTAFNRFFRFIQEEYPNVKRLSELNPTMMSEYVKYLKYRRVKKHGEWENLADRTINSYIKRLRYSLKIVDEIGTQRLREPLTTIKRPKPKRELYIPTDKELTRVSETLKALRKDKSERNRYIAFVAATALQFCSGRTNLNIKDLNKLRFDTIEDDGGIITPHTNRHVTELKGFTDEWYKDFLKERKEYVQHRYGNTPYLFPRVRNDEVGNLGREMFRRKFKKFMHLCELPQLTVRNFRYIYATKLHQKGLSLDEIEDILGTRKRTLKRYLEAAGMSSSQFTTLDSIAGYYPREMFDRQGNFRERDVKKLEEAGLITSRTFAGTRVYKVTEKGRSIHRCLKSLFRSPILDAFAEEGLTDGLSLEKIAERINKKATWVKNQIDEPIELNIFERTGEGYRPSSRYQNLILEHL